MTEPVTPTTHELPDIASTCPICNNGFRDEHFATLIWINEHTPAHLTCCEQADSRNPKLEGITFTAQP